MFVIVLRCHYRTFFCILDFAIIEHLKLEGVNLKLEIVQEYIRGIKLFKHVPFLRYFTFMGVSKYWASLVFGIYYP